VLLDALPLAPSGKLDRRALPAPSAVRARADGDSEPRDVLERQLVAIWEELLGVQPIGVTERFFDIGGSSLLAVRLLERINARIGQQIPVTALFEAPTVAQLADLLRERGWPGVLRLADRLPQVREPIVAIKPGGTKRPFFFVAPLGGVLPSNMLAGPLDLAAHFDPQQPYYGVQLPGLAHWLLPGLDLNRVPGPARLAALLSQHRPNRRIVEAAAAECLRALQQVQPAGPYRLGGFSTGGVLAFEIAQQLGRQGQPVGLLALVDTTSAGLGLTDEADDEADERSNATLPAGLASALAELPAPDMAELAWFIGRDLGAGRLAKDLPELHADLQQLDDDQRWHYAAEQLRSANAARDATPDEISKLFATYRLNKLSLSYVLASYAPQVYPGRITYFKASQVYAPTDSTLTGWERFSAEPLERYISPGDHGTLFQEPHVRVLVRLIQTCLDADAD